MATKVLPVAFDNWRERQLQRSLMTNSLVQEMRDKQKSLLEVYDSALSPLLLLLLFIIGVMYLNGIIFITIIIISVIIVILNGIIFLTIIIITIIYCYFSVVI